MGEESDVKLMTDVLYSPELDGTFISIKNLCKNGYSVYFHGDIGEVLKDGRQITVAPIANDLYTVHLSGVYTISNNGNCIHQWHRIFGHRNINAVKLMIAKNNLKVISYNL